MSTKKVVYTENAPAAIGPYSQAVVASGMVYCSGQVAIDPATKEVVPGDVQAQAEQVMKNLEAVLVAAGSDFSQVVKTTIYLADMDDFKAVNEVYGKHFPSHPPARATVQVSRLPLDVRVEVDAIALVP